jgi:hypothetical protein
MTEKQRLQELRKYQRELKEKQKAFNSLEEESKNYVSLINEMNDTFGNWGLDLTSLSSSIGKDYPVSTTLINQIITSREECSSELELWKLIRKFIPSDPLKVRMNFLDYDINFHQLVYWGSEFLNMSGVDLLYAVYLLLEQQLQKTPNELKGNFNNSKMRILLPEMTATFENDGFTCMDFSIHEVGNLNVLAKRR